ncbi:hypothetical protein QWM81_21495 [Streptomyces ficellus]|uniref:Uncharacterized protein n=1 Tax=Streptomyces ficellus TaxID=1977088 RepID=A0ABT7ZBZ4_9ACTN|nr:hypothetical protein [Streptomyces ficellus]MDN3296576.1 hypothetical protein [Streptomyces ficellus]
MAQRTHRLLAIAALTAATVVVPMTATAQAAPATAYTNDDRGHHDRWKHHDKDGKNHGRWNNDCGCDDKGHGKDGHGKDGHGKDGHGKDGHGKDGHGKGGSCYGGGLLGGIL